MATKTLFSQQKHDYYKEVSSSALQGCNAITKIFTCCLLEASSLVDNTCLKFFNQSECRRCLFNHPCAGHVFNFFRPPALLTCCMSFNHFFHLLCYKVRQSLERAKRTVRLPRPPLRRELKAAAPPLPVLRKARDQDPSLLRRQGKAQGLVPKHQDPDQKEPSLPVCIDNLLLVDFISCVS